MEVGESIILTGGGDGTIIVWNSQFEEIHYLDDHI